MNFGSFKEYNMKNRFFNRNLAGGAMLDIGVYALSFIRWFFDSKPDQLLSQVKPAPTGVDEQAGLLLTNQEGQMASVMLSLHSKQPKRGMVSCENGFIEIMEYPRAWEAKITDASTGESEIIKAGDNADALAYELADMERAINGDASAMHLDYTKDVMDLMTSFRRTWGYTYPEEENKIRTSKPLPGTHQMPGRGTSFHLQYSAIFFFSNSALIGFAICTFMPASFAACRSSTKALAVMAKIGMEAASSRP